MATYFPSSDNQRDGAPMLYLGEPLPTSYSDTPNLSSNMIMYTNYASDNTQPQNTYLQNTQQDIMSNLGGSQSMEQDFSSWRDRNNEMLFMQPPMAGQGLGQGQGQGQGQGLSLTLGTEIPSSIQIPTIQYRNQNSGFSSFLSPPDTSTFGEGSGRNESFRGDTNSQSNMPHVDMSSFGQSNVTMRSIPNSKYLKAAQQLLDEVVSVQKEALKRHDSKKDLKEFEGGSKNDSALHVTQETGGNSHGELSASEKQDLQNKMTKLLSMLDEVDRRYKQYYHQMQIVVSSFDVVAGRGAAKPYTALALQTISRHFRCLHDAITGQIQITRRNLGEHDGSGNGKGVGISRLRYVDQQLKQQRALQQLGMMQQHAWRPQRGLPENSVSILRAWLFEHFLHPYPKDSEKIMLARQTGLTRSQVSNWFINARVRLWKPMVEEMYKEEIGDVELHSNSSSDVANKAATKSDFRTSDDKAEDLQHSSVTSMTTTEHCNNTGQLLESSKSDQIPNPDMFGLNAITTFRDLNSGETKTTTRIQQHFGIDNNNPFASSDSERFMAAAAASAYHMSELGRFGSGNGVSLTLGLQQCEGGFAPVRGDVIYNTVGSNVGPETAEFDCLETGNRQRRFGSSHLLHDFVA